MKKDHLISLMDLDKKAGQTSQQNSTGDNHPSPENLEHYSNIVK